MNPNQKLLNIALGQYGIKEVAGKKDNPEVLKYFDVMGYDGSKMHDETAWCSAFVNWCAIQAGFPASGQLTARSWLNIGMEVNTPITGDIVVLWRNSPSDWRGHVGIYIKETDGWIYLLGGNQSNQVKISAYRRPRVLGFRRL